MCLGSQTEPDWFLFAAPTVKFWEAVGEKGGRAPDENILVTPIQPVLRLVNGTSELVFDILAGIINIRCLDFEGRACFLYHVVGLL